MVTRMHLGCLAVVLAFAATEAADVAAIKALSGSKEVRFVWATYSGGTYNYYKTDFYTKINAVDTRDNVEHQICPNGDCNQANYLDPLFVTGGSQIVYSVGGTENKTYVMDWDGKSRRLLCTGQVACPALISGVQWIYFQKVLHGPIYRLNMANPSQEEMVYNKKPVGGGGPVDNFQPWFHVSPDGSRAAWTYNPGDAYHSGVAWLPCIGSSGVDKELGSHNCWNAMSPDNTKHYWMYNGSHTDVTMYDSTLTTSSIVTISPVACYHKWTANDANFVVGTGPGQILEDNAKGNGQLYFGKMTNWKTIQWVKVNKDTSSRNAWNDAWVGDVSGSTTPAVAAPVIAPSTQSFADSVTVSLSTTTAGATIYYTVNGSDPTTGSTVYSSPFVVKQTTTVKAFAVKTGMTNSAVSVSAFTKNSVPAPAITPAAGSYQDSVRVTITCTDQTALIYYTTTGADPTTASTRYTAPFTIRTASTVKARAFSGTASSAISSSSYTITVNNPITVLAPNGGETFRIGQTMTIRWTANTSVVTYVSVFISVNDGLIWNEALGVGVTTTDPTWGAYPWTIPATIGIGAEEVSLVSKTALIKVRHYTDGSIYDVSNAVFTIDQAAEAIRQRAASSVSTGFSCQATLFDLAGMRRASGVLSSDRATGQPWWSAGDHAGRPLPAGTYLLKLSTVAGDTKICRVTLSKGIR